ncbi:hypothetical protein GCM10028827_00230 [Mucilaginibacter myungsuensis]
MLATVIANAQKPLVSASKQTQLISMAREESDTFQANYQQALSQAQIHGWPVRQQTKNGGLIMLQGVNERGFPLYLRTDNNATSAITTGTVAVQPGGVLGLNLTGSSANLQNKLAIWDGGWVLGTHQEFAGKTVSFRDQGGSVIEHATHVGGTMFAKGTYAPAKGMAFGATTLSSYDFNTDIAEITAAAGNLLLSNHSYGGLSGWVFNDSQNRWEWKGMPGDTEDYTFGFYDNRAQSFDRIAYNAPYYLIVQSAGNSRSDNGPFIGEDYWGYRSRTDQTIINKGPRPATISSNDGYDILNTTANAKNVLTVGAINALPYGPMNRTDIEVAAFSGWGPTDDGRVKPDVVGAGVNVLSTSNNSNTSYATLSGTSMAAPNVTGSLYLLQECYSQKNAGNFMLSATLKGLACHTAFDAGTIGPDYVFGWGVLDMKRAAQAITDNGTFSLIKENILTQNQTQSFDVVASGKGVVAATICWTDIQGAVATGMPVNDRTPKLINDLDIRISDGGSVYLPWVMDPANPSAAAQTGDNIRDNVEQVYVAGAVPGKTYTITVTNKGTFRSGPQAYSLIVTGVGGKAYCASKPLADQDSRIDNVTLADLNYTPGAGCRSYSDVTSRTVTLEQAKTYPLSLTLGTCGNNFNKIAKVYIDLNADGTIDPVTELMATTPVTPGTATYTGSIAVPASVTAETYSLMRIVLSETSDSATITPCGNYAKGETQDYRVLFTKTSTDAGITSISTSNPGGSCAGPTNITVKLKNYGSAAIANIPVTVTVTSPNNTLTTLNGNYIYSIAPGAEENFTLSGTFEAVAATTYAVTATTKLSGDLVTANDQLAVNIATGTPATATGLQAYYCDDTKKYILRGNADGGILWYKNATDLLPFTAGSPAHTLQPPVNGKYYAGINDFTGTVGPEAKTTFTGGSYNQFTPDIFVNTSVPVVLESAKLYVGRAGRVTFTVKNDNGLIVSTSSINVGATRNPSGAGALPDDPTDQGRVYALNLLFPAAGKYTISTSYENGATLFRSNAGVKGYPFSVGGVFSIVGNSAVSSDLQDTVYNKGFYYYFYNIKLKSAGCASTSRQEVLLTKPVVTNSDTVLVSNFSVGNQWYYNGELITGAIGQRYTPTQSGKYKVGITLNSGCMSFSDEFSYARVNLHPDNSAIGLSVFPVPASSKLNILFRSPVNDKVTISMVNTAGQIMRSDTQNTTVGDFSYVMDVSKLISGTYILKITTGGKTFGRKVMVIK